MRQYKLFLILPLMALSPGLLLAQPYVLWVETYGGYSYDADGFAVPTPDGGCIVTGSRYGYGPLYDFYLVKADSEGVVQWLRTYQSGEGLINDRCYSSAVANDGTYIMAGSTQDCSDDNSSDFFLVRTDSNGDILWTRTYGSVDNEEAALDVFETYDRGWIAAGWTQNAQRYEDIYLVRTDRIGDSLWTRTYGNANDDEVANAVLETPDGGFLVAGTITTSRAPGDVYLVRVDAYGDTLWTKRYGGTDQDEGWSVAPTLDGGFLVVGRTWSFAEMYSDIWVLRIDVNGDTLWTRTYSEKDHDCGSSVAATSDGGFIVCGYTGDIWAGFDLNYYVMRADSVGDVLWDADFGGDEDDVGRSVFEASEGYVVAGVTESFSWGESDLYVLRLAEEQPDVSVALTPDATIVERGGILGYTVEVSNYGDLGRSFEYWSDAFLPNGKPYGKNPILGPKRFTLKAGKTKVGYAAHRVPRNAPLKTYTLCGRIGWNPEGMWTEDCFEFTVVEGISGGRRGEDWEVVEDTF